MPDATGLLALFAGLLSIAARKAPQPKQPGTGKRVQRWFTKPDAPKQTGVRLVMKRKHRLRMKNKSEQIIAEYLRHMAHTGGHIEVKTTR